MTDDDNRKSPLFSSVKNICHKGKYHMQEMSKKQGNNLPASDSNQIVQLSRVKHRIEIKSFLEKKMLRQEVSR